MSTTNTHPPDSPLPADPPQTVLLVEDDGLVLELYSNMLQRLGHHVHTATDGDEALETFQTLETTPTWLMADLMLPGLSGLELLERLRRRVPGLPAVVVSGRADFEVAESGDQRTIFLAKPFQLGDLRVAIEQALDGADRSRGAAG